MRVGSICSASSFGAREALKGVIYTKPLKNGATQEGIISEALSELESVEFDKNDIAYMNAMGINPPFKNGKEAVDCLKANNIPIQYGKFSDKNVHACLAKGDKGKTTVLINHRYKNSTGKPEILATAEAIIHESGHAKDNDTQNSIQEELDNLSLNVLTHRAFENKYPHVFDKSNSFFFREGVKLYPKLFYQFGAGKTALKERVADKYGHMQAGDERHPSSKLACDIKALDILS